LKGITYKYIQSKLDTGIVETQKYSRNKSYNIRKTVVDSIKDFEKIGGLEELLNCISSIIHLDETAYRIFRCL
jgi:hypothetical protein